MPLLIILLLILLVAQIGFWDTIGAILGVTLSIIVTIALVLAILFLAAQYWWGRMSKKR